MSDPSSPPSPPLGLTLLHTLQGHTSPVWSVAWSPDGSLLASGSDDRTVRLWDSSRAQHLRTLQGHTGAIASVAWSPDGALLASGSVDRTVRLWDDPSRAQPLHTLQGHTDWVRSVVWSPDGALLASGSVDRTVRLWDPSRAQLLHTLQGHTGYVYSVAWSSDGSLLASGSFDQTVRLWDPSRAQHLHTLQGHTNPVWSVAWSPDGSLLASGSDDTTVRLWDSSRAQHLHTLQGHTGSVDSVAWSPDGTLLASVSSTWPSKNNTGVSELRLWRTDTWEQVALLDGLVGTGLVAWHPRLPQLLANATRVEDIALYHVDIPLLLSRPAARDSVRYKSAKVVLVGESGVGKSGLALRLTGQPFAATESTHGRHIWPLETQEVTPSPGVREQRETWLWDLAGQRDYRLLHQLHLHEATVALLVFDASHDRDPLAGIRYWHRALRLARRDAHASPLRTLLVAARCDRGRSGVSRQQVEALTRELGCMAFVETSARTGQGLDALTQAIQAALDWEQVPGVTSTTLLQQLKSFLLADLPAGRIVRTQEELYQAFLLADRARVPGKALRRQVEMGLEQMEGQGALRRLRFGNLVLLQPERLDGYASALLIAVGNEPDGLGIIAEARVQQGQFAIPDEVRLTDPAQEQVLLLAMIEELVRHELALREGGFLLFPSQPTREHPEQEMLLKQQRLTFGFAGPVLSIYTTLVVRLAQCGVFQHEGVWHRAATYTTRLGGRYGLVLSMRSEERVEVGVCFDEATREEMCYHFEAFVQQHLERLASGSVERRRRYVCPTCGEPFVERQVQMRLERGFTTIRCTLCETDISLLDGIARLSTSSAPMVTQMEQAANTRCDQQSVQVTMQGKIETQDFDVFLCHNTQDKPAVKRIGEQLKQLGLLPWLDEWELRPGLPWQRTLEQQITKIKATAVFVGTSGIGPWQQQELDAFLREFVARGCPVIPVLLPDAPQQPMLPVFLKGMTWVDFRVPEPEPMQQLRWGITGERTQMRAGR